MHPSTALATVLVDELVRGGAREAVLSPGSRSAPLAYALEQADREGRLRLHVRVDERSAGFLALGLARATGVPVPVVTTSGTAVANLHPAVLEAHHSGIPVVVLSADRPAELRGTGANQTTVQPGMFAGALRWEADLPAPESVSPAANAHWRSTVCRALAAAIGRTDPFGGGPVHLNVSLRDPLAPDLASAAQAPEGRPDGGPWTVAQPLPGVAGRPLELSEGEEPSLRTLVLLGDLPAPHLTRRALRWAAAAGWPVLAEPFGVLPVGETVVPHGVLVAGRVGRDPELASRLAPDRVVAVGRLTLFRELGALGRTAGVRVEQVSATAQWTDPSHGVRRVHGVGVLAVPPARAQGWREWVEAWVEAGRALTPAVRAATGLDAVAEDSAPAGAAAVAPAGTASSLSGGAGAPPSGAGSARGTPGAGSALTGPAVAATVAASLTDDDVLVLGSSNAPRDLALAHDGTGPAPRVVAGRGLAGIDGTVSVAVGAALALAPARTVALMGDLTFLHDTNGLLIGPTEPRPDLTVVVVNDDGGGIFTTLEYGEPDRSATADLAAATERLFGTPHGTDLAALCAAHRVAHVRAETLGQLRAALAAPADGLRVIEVPVGRAGHRPLRDQLRG